VKYEMRRTSCGNYCIGYVDEFGVWVKLKNFVNGMDAALYLSELRQEQGRYISAGERLRANRPKKN